MWYVFMVSLYLNVTTPSNVVKSSQGFPTQEACVTAAKLAAPGIAKEQPNVAHVFYCGKEV